MSNKKVYLAKSTLASGFDVEYVKSHLSRIPGIVIVEAGDSISPGECAAFVIVPDKDFRMEEKNGKAVLSKNVIQALERFFEEYSGADYAENCVFVYHDSKTTDEPLDVEESFPLAFYGIDSEIHYKKKENFERFGSLEIEEEDEQELLYVISEIIDAPHAAWVTVKRHFIPKPEYAMPPVPSIEERLHNILYAIPEESISERGLDRRLLLLRIK